MCATRLWNNHAHPKSKKWESQTFLAVQRTGNLRWSVSTDSITPYIIIFNSIRTHVIMHKCADRAISVRGDIWDHKTSLSPSLFIEVHASSQVFIRSYICMLGASMLPSFCDTSIVCLELWWYYCIFLFFILSWKRWYFLLCLFISTISYKAVCVQLKIMHL